MTVVEFPISELLSLPVMGRAMAGTTRFQSPADDYQEDRINLARELVTTIPSVFCMRAQVCSTAGSPERLLPIRLHNPGVLSWFFRTG